MSAMTHRLVGYWPDGKKATTGTPYPSAAAAEAERREQARALPGWRWEVEPIVQAANLPLGVPVQVWVFPDAGTTMEPGDVRVIATVAGEGGGAVRVARAFIGDGFDVWMTGEYSGGERTMEHCADWATAYQEGLTMLQALTLCATFAVQRACGAAATEGVTPA